MISLLRMFAIICNNHRENIDSDRNMIYRDFIDHSLHYDLNLNVEFYYENGVVILVCKTPEQTYVLRSDEALEFYDSYVKPTLINIS